MNFHLLQLGGRRGVEHPDGLVRTSEREILSIRRKGDAKECIRSHDNGAAQLRAVDFPNLYLAETSGRAAYRRKRLAIRRKTDGMDALSPAYQANRKPRAIRPV